MNEQISALQQLLASPKRCVLVSHRNPDGDALGSTLAWMYFLRKKGHEAVYVSPTDYTSLLKWIQGTQEVISFESDLGKKLAISHIQQADVIFCLDFNAISRLEDLGEAINASTATKVMIDHHQQPEDFAQITFSNTAAGATAEMVYDIIEALGETDLIDEVMAENLYVGLATDTGFFQFNNTTQNVHRVAGALVARGVDSDYISGCVNNTFSERRLRYFGWALLEKLRMNKKGTVATICVGKEDAKRFNLQPGDNEGLVNFPFKIEGVKVSVLFTEEPDKVKMSLRSKGDFDVNELARKHFNGGGHRNAAGGKLPPDIKKAEETFLKVMNELSV